MSLLEEFMEDCKIMNLSKVSDGEGGFTSQWTEGAAFKAAIVLDQTMQARIAEKQGVTSVYTVTTKKTVTLDYHDVIKRVKDGKYFRVTSIPEKKSPESSTLDMAQVTAEKWELTT